MFSFRSVNNVAASIPGAAQYNCTDAASQIGAVQFDGYRKLTIVPRDDKTRGEIFEHLSTHILLRGELSPHYKGSVRINDRDPQRPVEVTFEGSHITPAAVLLHLRSYVSNTDRQELNNLFPSRRAAAVGQSAVVA